MGFRAGATIGLAAIVSFSPSTRIVGSLAMLAMVLLTSLLVHRSDRSWRRTAAAVMFGAAPAAMTAGTVHDVLPTVLPTNVSRLVIVMLWVLAARTLGTTLAAGVRGPANIRLFLIRTTAVALASGWYLAGLLRQFLPGADLVTRLGFAILEEDNAHVIGVAREVATLGPRGGELAEIYGTGFIVLPDLLIRLFGGPLTGELSDPRQAAITTFTVSSMVVIVLLGLALWTIGTAIPSTGEDPHPRRLATHIMAFAGTLLGAWIALAVIIVIPMRTSFLTFVWGLALLAIAIAIASALPEVPRPTDHASVFLHVLAAAWLLLGSWPFVVVGLVPIGGWMLMSLRIRRPMLSNRGSAVGLVVVAIVSLTALGSRWAQWGALAEVLSYGRTLLTLRASAIEADAAAWLTLIGLLAIVLTGSVNRSGVQVRMQESSSARRVMLAIAPVGALAFLYLGLVLAALALTDGELNYAGDKLRYAILALGLLLGAPVAARSSEQWSLPSQALLVSGLAAAIILSPTIGPDETWWDRSGPQRFLQAETVVTALRGSGPDVPLRCLPPPDLEADRLARRATYECIRFVEDAFNADRSAAFRFTFLDTQDSTFRDAVEVALTDRDFAGDITRMTMLGGWAGLPPERTSGLPSPWPDDR